MNAQQVVGLGAERPREKRKSRVSRNGREAMEGRGGEGTRVYGNYRGGGAQGVFATAGEWNRPHTHRVVSPPTTCHGGHDDPKSTDAETQPWAGFSRGPWVAWQVTL